MRALGLSLAALAPFLSLASLAACGAPPPPPPVAPPAPAPPPPLVCAEGMADCDQNRENACEINLDTANDHCGACGRACGDAETCLSGACRRVVALAAGDDHACAITDAGAVACWGDNTRGEIGDGTRELRPAPVEVAGVADAVAVSTGEGITCAVQRAGHLICWGEPTDGKARAIAGYEDITAVATGEREFCAVRRSGAVVCAPLGSEGAGEPKPMSELKDAVAITAGRYHYCALHKNGEVSCWGDRGLLGADEPGSEYDKVGPRRVKGLNDAAQIAAGRSHTCAVRKSGQIACWGKNYSAQLGDGSHEERKTPVNAQFITDATVVTAGDQHTCALRRTGEVACWGQGSSGELGIGERIYAKEGPVTVKGFNDATYVAAGERFACAARKSGKVMCWGSASRGRLGNGTLSEVPRPIEVPGVDGAASLALGRHHSCVLGQNGSVSCWGRGAYASEGPGKRDRGIPPMAVPGLDEVVDLQSTYSQLCATRKNGDVLCFRGGLPNYLNESDNRAWVPEAIKGLGPVKAVFDTGSGSPALLKSGQVVLWTVPERGWFTNKPTEPAQKFAIAGLSDVVELAGDDSFMCGRRRSGKVSCFRYSAYGTFNKKNPVKPGAIVEIPEVKDAIDLAASGSDFCAATKEGEVLCWSGYAMPRPEEPPQKPAPGAPKPPPAPKPQKPTPVAVKRETAIGGVTQVALGYGFRCGLYPNGEVACIGQNNAGQLGLGEGALVARYEGTRVAGLNDAVFIAAGGSHACAVRRSGKVVCWGDNEADQVGNKDRAYASTPVEVVGLGK